MLSVLIPVFNFDVRELTLALNNQCKQANIPYEIIVLDDYSSASFKNLNAELKNVEGIFYEELYANIGRAKIRNQLAQIARYEYLLFMDCDSKVVSDNYIKNYVQTCNIQSNREILVYGGRVYEKTAPEDQKLLLHWHYGRKREALPVEIRQTNPNQSFMTNNFLISKSIFQKLSFNENLKGYGHEDTLFGLELKKLNINITHIDNPLMHTGLEENIEFLRKTREGIINLKRIINAYDYQKNLVKDITLLSYYVKSKKLKIRWLIKVIFKFSKMRMEKKLTTSTPNLFIFDLYKLGVLCSIE